MCVYRKRHINTMIVERFERCPPKNSYYSCFTCALALGALNWAMNTDTKIHNARIQTNSISIYSRAATANIYIYLFIRCAIFFFLLLYRFGWFCVVFRSLSFFFFRLNQLNCWCSGEVSLCLASNMEKWV